MGWGKWGLLLSLFALLACSSGAGGGSGSGTNAPPPTTPPADPREARCPAGHIDDDFEREDPKGDWDELGDNLTLDSKKARSGAKSLFVDLASSSSLTKAFKPPSETIEVSFALRIDYPPAKDHREFIFSIDFIEGNPAGPDRKMRLLSFALAGSVLSFVDTDYVRARTQHTIELADVPVGTVSGWSAVRLDIALGDATQTIKVHLNDTLAIAQPLSKPLPEAVKPDISIGSVGVNNTNGIVRFDDVSACMK